MNILNSMVWNQIQNGWKDYLISFGRCGMQGNSLPQINSQQNQIHNCHFDYNAFWQKVILNRKVVKAVAYAIESKDEKQRQFQNILRGIGFEVKLKPFIQRIDSSAKGDWDVGITVDILEYAEESDIIILASGDGDFDILVKKLIEKYNSIVEVYGVKQLTAISLINSASKFISIESDLLLNP